MREAADVLAPVRDSVVVFGAVAVEVALADANVSVTPTRDVDLVVAAKDVESIIGHLESAELRLSEVPHEAGFTWVRGDLKIQLVRSFDPFPKGLVRGVPYQPPVTVARDPRHQVEVSFDHSPEEMRFLCVSSACVIALKRRAFGRIRSGEATTPVDRDFSDVHLLLRQVPDTVLDDYEPAEQPVRVWLEEAVDLLADDAEAAASAASELVRSGLSSSRRAGESDVRRTAARFRRRLQDRFPVAAERAAERARSASA